MEDEIVLACGQIIPLGSGVCVDLGLEERLVFANDYEEDWRGHDEGQINCAEMCTFTGTQPSRKCFLRL
jgi:hypothetical protein